MRFFFNHSLTEHLHIFDGLRKEGAFVAGSCQRETTPQKGHLDAFFVEPEIEYTQADHMRKYAQWIADTAASVGAEWVIPYRHRIELSALADVFESNGTKLLVAADFDTMNFVEDKARFLSQMKAEGMRTGDFRVFRTREEFEAGIGELGAVDLCVKPTEGIGGRGFRRLLAEGSYEGLFGSDSMVLGMDALRELLDKGPLGQEMMVMPYLRGPERSVDIACLEGRTLGVVTRMRKRFTQIVGDDPVAREMAVHLVKRLNLSGLVNMQTRIDHTGQQCLLELNTRASGGVGKTMISDVSLPAVLLRGLASGGGEELAFPKHDVEALREYLYTAAV